MQFIGNTTLSVSLRSRAIKLFTARHSQFARYLSEIVHMIATHEVPETNMIKLGENRFVLFKITVKINVTTILSSNLNNVKQIRFLTDKIQN